MLDASGETVNRLASVVPMATEPAATRGQGGTRRIPVVDSQFRAAYTLYLGRITSLGAAALSWSASPFSASKESSMLRKNRMLRSMALALTSAGLLWQGACSTDFVTNFFAAASQAQIPTLVADAIFFLLDNAFVRLNT